MNDTDDTANRRERMQALRRRRQAARNESEPSRKPLQRSIAGSPDSGVAGGGGAGGKPAPGQRAKQFAGLILKWMETTSEPGAETIAGTRVSRDGLTKLMAQLSSVERRDGPGAKIAKMLRGFLARPPQPGETVIDGVNIEQLRKLVGLATRIRDQGLGRQKQTRQGAHRFWDGGTLSVGEGDEATADLDAEFESLDQPTDSASESPVGEQPGEPGEESAPHEKRKQTKRNPPRASRKK